MSDKHSPAFPAIDGGTAFYERGLSKREYFAGLALQGLIAQSPKAVSAAEFARQAVIAADALLVELSTPQP